MLFPFWSHRTNRTPQAGRIHIRHRPQLCLEPLEERLCPSGGYLLVGSYDTNSVLRYDEHTGAFVDQFDPHNLANLKNPVGGVLAPDHNLYVSSNIFSSNNQKVVQYNGATGAFQSAFASQNVTSPRGVLVGPDGNLYVADGNDAASGDPASVERFDAKTGAFLNYFVAPGSGGLEHPSYMVFGPNGGRDGKLDLYVASAHAGSILRYDGTTGAFKGVFVSADSGGLDAPQMMVFGPDGNLYVASGNWFNGSNGPFYSGDFPAGAVLRFQGPSGPNPGTFMGTFIMGGSGGLANPIGLLFAPDPSGNGNLDLYVSSSLISGKSNNLQAKPGTSEVLRYDGPTGTFLGTFVIPGSGGLKLPTFMTFMETNPTTLNYNGKAPVFGSNLIGAINGPSSSLTSRALSLSSNPVPLAIAPSTALRPPNVVPFSTESALAGILAASRVDSFFQSSCLVGVQSSAQLNSAKRPIPGVPAGALAGDEAEQILSLDEGLGRQAAEYSQKAMLVKHRSFGGAPAQAAADALEISPAIAAMYWAYEDASL